jgi:hypothetical protein
LFQTFIIDYSANHQAKTISIAISHADLKARQPAGPSLGCVGALLEILY